MATTIKKDKKNESDGLVNTVMFRYFPYWPVFVLLIGIAAFSAWAYIQFFAVPSYRSTASILVKDEKKGVEDSRTLESLNGISSKKIVENEMQVIGSRELIKQAVLNLRLYSPVFEEDQFRDISAYSSTPIVVEAKDPDNITPQEKVYFTFNSVENKVVIGKNSYIIDQWVTTPFGELKFIRNTKKTAEVQSPLYFSLQPAGETTDDLSKAMKIEAPNKLASVINLRLDDETRERGKNILDELIKVYSLAAAKEKNALALATLKFLDSRIDVVKNELDSIEKNEQGYKTTHGIVNISEQGKLFIQNSGINDTKLTEINTQLTVLDQVEQYVNSKDNQGSIVPATLGISDPILSKSLEELYTAQLQYERLKRTVGENNPLLSSVANQIERIRPNILETIRSQRKNLQASKANISSSNSDYTAKLSTIPGQERELVEISRQKDIKNQVYAFLLNKREETALTYANAVPDSKIVDKAESSVIPVSPKSLLIYLAAVVLAFLIGIAYITLKETLSNKIIFRSEIEEFTPVPVIAEITHISRPNFFNKFGKQKKMAVAEQFRQLRMAFKLYRKQAVKKRLLVTSSIGGEGKSFVSNNLAKSLASSGKKVVLIDFDMRNPKTSSLFSLNNRAGIKEYLEDEKNAEDIIQKTEYDNLFVIPAGEPAVNPTELLLSSSLGKLFEYLDNAGFDYIIADTAPIQPVTDAYIISEFCDTTLFVVRHRYTPKAMIKLLDENNKIKALKNLNIVFNGVKSRGVFSKSICY